MAVPLPTGITTLFDSYNRQARLFPGLLTIFPPLLAVLAWFPWLIVSSVTATLLTLATSCGLLYALVSWARTRGKRIEPKLLKEWGGWPTTILMRHNSWLDVHTRRRYHEFLAAALPQLSFPTADQELANPDAADAVYSSAVIWLKERTRGKEFSMVHRENAQYGFRRNLLGLKPIGISLCLLMLAASLVAVAYANPAFIALIKSHDWRGAFQILGGLGVAVLSALAINFVAIFVWVRVVSKLWVKEAGFQYAAALLATCDQIPLKQAAT